MKKIILVSFLLFCSAVLAEPRLRPTDWAVPIIGSNLDNLYQVDEGIYRSEQPSRSDFNDISILGISEVLNLREYHSDDDEAAGLAINLHHIKINAGAISEEQVIQALDIILKRKGPILVHCWHGSDRTGAIIAAYRVVIEHWSKDKAIEELIDGGFGYHANVYPNVVELIKNLNIEKVNQRLGLRIK